MNYEELFLKAKEARQMAYAPYSNFFVGAALLTTAGEIFTGCNIENASYGLTICAERVAVAKAVSSGFHKIQAVALYGSSKEIISPCGACRQVILEFGEDIDIIMGNDKGIQMIKKASELLPGAFTLEIG